jgi:hypothetical protein
MNRTGGERDALRQSFSRPRSSTRSHAETVPATICRGDGVRSPRPSASAARAEALAAPADAREWCADYVPAVLIRAGARAGGVRRRGCGERPVRAERQRYRCGPCEGQPRDSALLHRGSPRVVLTRASTGEHQAHDSALLHRHPSRKWCRRAVRGHGRHGCAPSSSPAEAGDVLRDANSDAFGVPLKSPADLETASPTSSEAERSCFAHFC